MATTGVVCISIQAEEMRSGDARRDSRSLELASQPLRSWATKGAGTPSGVTQSRRAR